MRCFVSGMELYFLTCYMVVPDDDYWCFFEHDVVITLDSLFSSIDSQFPLSFGDS